MNMFLPDHKFPLLCFSAGWAAGLARSEIVDPRLYYCIAAAAATSRGISVPLSRPEVGVHDCEQPGGVNLTGEEPGSVCTLPRSSGDAASLIFLRPSISPTTAQSKSPQYDI